MDSSASLLLPFLLSRESGIVSEVAIVTNTPNDGFLTVAEYVEFLNTSQLAFGAVLVSTAPCEVRGMTLTVNSSIMEATAGERLAMYPSSPGDYPGELRWKYCKLNQMVSKPIRQGLGKKQAY